MCQPLHFVSAAVPNAFPYISIYNLALIVLITCILLLAIANKRRQYAPGPPAAPFVGNIFSFPVQGGWNILTQYKRVYGDLVFFHGLGNSIIVLNSLKVVNDLLEKRAEVYSDRPVFTVVGELMGLDQSLPLLPYGKEWREQRRLLHLGLNSSSIKRYQKPLNLIASNLFKSLLNNPDNFFANVRLASGQIILALTYGLSVDSAEDEYISHAEKTMELIGKSTVPGAFLCDFIPIMKYLPKIIPFQKKARCGRQMIHALVTRPFNHVKEQMAAGNSTASLTHEILSNGRPGGDTSQTEFENRVKWATGSMYGAGGETTYSTILCFFLAMTLFPEAQSKAQAEIDSTVGYSRLPTDEDRLSLPYVNALIKEVLRWHPSLPLGIARMTNQNDIYNGFYIPKGTIVVPNSWAIAMECNELEGDDSRSFFPERFLDINAEVVDPAKWAFGYGRRVCPGKLLAESSVFIIVAGILALFDIRPVHETDTKSPTFTPNLVSYPDPFKCQIIPRSSHRDALIHEIAGCTALDTINS